MESESPSNTKLLDRSQFVQISVPVETEPNHGSKSLPTLPPMQRVSRHEEAPWLLDSIDISLRNLDAAEAITLIAGKRPVRFDLSLTELPIVGYASDSGHTIKTALDAIVAQADWTYGLVDGAILVRDLETRTLLLLAQPGTVDAKMSVNALDAGSGGSTGASDGGTVQHASDPYEKEIEPVVTELIAADLERGLPSTVRLLPNANALMVTARPSTVQRIAALVETYNERVSQSVRIHITVYEVTSSTKQSIGTRLQAVLHDPSAAFIGGWDVRPLETDAQFAFELLNPTKRYAGTDALLEWLDRIGEATINFNDAIEVRNNQIAASSSTRTYQYISSITREQDAQGRERTEVQREQLRTGWSISVHPTIGDDAVTVRLSLARRSLVEERPFQFGESVGTNFVTDDQVRAMTVSLADGESRIITALRASDKRNDRSKLAGLVTRRGSSQTNTESVLLMRVELI
ncbi:MAG: hypothetical protein OXG15_06315 [Gammaproteobacteria bacterium]|nr:hypothetical protein [Gammaproteobacteria bacterium]